jgi:hypothetical protein
MAITWQSPGAVAYSAQNGTSVSPAYPASSAEGEKLILIIGMKPSTANSGSVTTPGSWNLVTSITGAGGYGTTLGADTGNTNLFVYERTVPAGGLSGSLSVTVGTNNVCWAFMSRLTNTSNYIWDSVAGATGEDTTGGNVSITFGSNPGVTANDLIIAAMCIPTDVQTPSQFSAQAFTQTSVTFGTVTEINEPDSGTGNDIGGFSCRALVSSGTGSANPVMTATAGGTTTNVRGPGVFIRIREKNNLITLTGNNCNQPNTTTTGAVTQARNLQGNNVNQKNRTTWGSISKYTNIIILNSGTSWTVPSDWNSADNKIEVWGGGAGGHSNNNVSLAGAGGGGGYSSITNLALTPSDSIGYVIGAGGVGETQPSPPGDGGGTWFNGTSLSACSVSANGGLAGTTSGTGGLGGSTTGVVGSTKYAGGNGGSSSGVNTTTGAGGGSAASAFGAGTTGGSGIVTSPNTPEVGAVGGNAYLAGVGGDGGPNISPWLGGNGVANPDGGGGGGGGGCGGSGNTAGNGGNGAIPAGGGGSGCTSRDNGSNGGAGGTGQIRISYTPPVVRYWVGGAGTWDATSTTHWSLTNGGAGGASVPDSTTDVIFNGSSDTGTGFTVTLSGTIACRSWTVENHDVTITFSGSPTLSVHRDIRWIPVSTNIVASGLSGTCNLAGGSGVSQSILFNNITVGINLRFAGTTTTTYNLASDFTGNSNSAFTLVNGILNTQNYTISVDHWTTETGTSTTNLGSSTITITGSQGMVYGSGRTFNAGTSTIKFTYAGGPAASITLPNYTLHNIEFPNTSFNDFQINVFGGNLTCNNFTVTNATNGRKGFSFGDLNVATGFLTLTVTGTLTITGSNHRYCSVFSTAYYLHNSPMTISANAVNLNYVNFFGITGAGTAAPFTGTSLGNIGWNGGITFTSPKTTYFRGAAGTTVWDGSNVFSATSGGAGALANYPLPQDTVIVDENTLSSTISSSSNNIRPEFSTFDASTRTTALTFSRNSRITVGGQAGAIKTPAAVTWSATADSIFIHSDCDLDVVNALNTPIFMRVRKQGTPSSGTVKLLRNLTHNSNYAFTNIGGLLDLNGFTATLWSYVTGTTNSNTNQERGLSINGGAMNLAYSSAITYALECSQNLGHTFTDGEYIDIVGSFPSNTITVLSGNYAGLSYAPSIRLGGSYATYSISTLSTYLNSIDGSSGSGAINIGNNPNYYGDIKLGTNLSRTVSTFEINLIGSKNSAIDAAGLSVPTGIAVNKSAGYGVSLSSNLTLSSSKNFTLTQGDLSLGSYTLQVNRFTTSGSASRTIKFDTGTIAVSENGTPWANSNATNLSITGQSTGKIKFLSTTGSSTFQGQGLSYPNLELAAAGDIVVTGANTFYNLTNSVQPASITLPASTTTTFESFSLRGTAGNLVVVKSSSTTLKATLYKASGDVDCNYLNINDNAATGISAWYAGANSTDGLDNTGWIFANKPVAITLTGNNCNQPNTTTTGAITRVLTLTGNNCKQPNTTTTGAISQTHVLTGNNCNQPNTTTTGAINRTLTLTGNNVNQPNTTTTGAVSRA